MTPRVTERVLLTLLRLAAHRPAPQHTAGEVIDRRTEGLSGVLQLRSPSRRRATPHVSWFREAACLTRSVQTAERHTRHETPSPNAAAALRRACAAPVSCARGFSQLVLQPAWRCSPVAWAAEDGLLRCPAQWPAPQLQLVGTCALAVEPQRRGEQAAPQCMTRSPVLPAKRRAATPLASLLPSRCILCLPAYVLIAT